MTPRKEDASFPEPEFTDPAVELAHRSAIRSIERVVHETATPTPPQQALDFVADLLRNGPALVVTGAGVSTASGIPDYRSPGGRLSKGRPMTYQEFAHSRAVSYTHLTLPTNREV